MEKKISDRKNRVVVKNGKANFILNEATQNTRYVPIEEGIRMAIEIAEGIMEGR